MIASLGELRAMFLSLDRDADGQISPAEYEFLKLAQHAAWAGEENVELRSRAPREAFGMYEMEGQGCITPASLGRMLGRLDLDGDSELSFDEFKITMS